MNWQEIVTKAKQFSQGAKDKVSSVVSGMKDFAGRLNPNAPIEGKAWSGDENFAKQTPAPEKYPMPPVQKPTNMPSSQPKQEVPKEIQNIIKPTQTTSNYSTGAVNYDDPRMSQPRNPNVYKSYKIPEQVDKAITKASKMFPVPKGLMMDMAAQESSFNPGLTNETPAGKAAGNPTGLFQYTDGTWNGHFDENGRWVPGVLDLYARNPKSSLYGKLPNEDRKDPETNAIMTAYLIHFGQLGKWDASEDVWGNYWSPQELEDMGFYKQSQYHQAGVRPSVRLKPTNTP